MITIPNKRPTTLRSFEVDFGTTVAEAIWRRVVQSINWYNDAMPVGIILPFYQSKTYANGDPIPNPIGLFQFCDGAPVTPTDSPLFGQSVPDLRDFFLKGFPTIGTIGGQSSIDLTHNHGGLTGTMDDGDFSALRISDGGDQQEHHAHRHFIANDLTVQSTLPPYIALQYYMKVDGAASIDAAIQYAQLDDDFSKYGKILSTELMQSIKAAIDYIDDALPVGEVIPIMTNIPGVTVNPKIWQECDGSEITDVDSPLRSLPSSPRFVPNLIDRYVKFPTIGLVGSSGGSNTKSDMGHSHNGFTGGHDYPDNSNTDEDHYPAGDHRHTIGSALTGTYNIEPPFFTVKFFMRIQ